MRFDQAATKQTMLNTSPQNRKIVNVPKRITSGHIESALHYVRHELKLSAKNSHYYSIDSSYNSIREQFPGFPIHTLFLDADLFEGEPNPIPSKFLIERGFVRKLSEIIELTETEKKKDKFCITEIGYYFLWMTIARLKDEIINNIFYRA